MRNVDLLKTTAWRLHRLLAKQTSETSRVVFSQLAVVQNVLLESWIVGHGGSDRGDYVVNEMAVDCPVELHRAVHQKKQQFFQEIHIYHRTVHNFMNTSRKWKQPERCLRAVFHEAVVGKSRVHDLRCDVISVREGHSIQTLSE